MTAEKIRVLLISDSQFHVDKITEFCRHSTDFWLTQDESKDIDIILISDEQIQQFIETELYADLSVPIIYLRNQQQNEVNLSLIKEKMEGVIDVDKTTPSEFERTIKSSIDYSHLMSELKEQKTLLKKLIESIGTEKDAIGSKFSDKGVISARSLVEQNKLLINRVVQQNIKLKTLARIDYLTGIPNVRNFQETLQHLLAHAKWHDHMFALLSIDINKFKAVNDRYGPQIGDRLLEKVAQRLKQTLRKGDFVARVRGGKFVVILHEINSTHAAGLVAWKFIEDLSKPYLINSHEISIGVSIGIACYPMAGETSEELIKSADAALYRAKCSKELKYAYATLEMQQDHVKQSEIERELKFAIDRHELYVVYQPIYTLPEKNLHGFEVLLRWKSDKLGNVSPAQFIPVAENSGLIQPIGHWLLEKVCKHISLWVKKFSKKYKFSINLSPVQLDEEALLALVNELLKQYKLSYDLFEFEVTEMAIMYQSKNINKAMQKLTDLGASHALDDYGTGYSPISHLQYLPIGTIKIDPTFITDIENEKDEDGIVSSVVSLAHKMNLKVIAEGVENKKQLNALLRLGCDYVQGYYFSKPLSVKAAEKLIHSEESNQFRDC